MIEITEQNPREILEILLRIWESSVRATHKFLNEREVGRIKGEVEAMFAQMGGVICAKFDGEIAAFMICADEKIEALFVSSSHFRKGIGAVLVRHAKEHMGARFVDVNEQNPQAIAFYEKMGFKAFDRSELDGSGAPYPIIKMRL